MNTIEVSNVNYSSDQFNLKNISFKVPQGFVTGFIGRNGAGKTTIIRLIMDLYQPQTGVIRVLEEDMALNPIELKNRIGFVYAENYFNERWTTKQLEKMIAPFYRKWDHQVFEFYLEKFDLPINKSIKTFSTGMKMKLSLAVAFSHHAELYIFDEPTSGLDPLARNELLEIIQQELIDENKTIFMSTHIISDLEKIADYIIHLSDGEVILNGSKEQLLQRYQVVSGAIEDLDDELASLLIFEEHKRTGFIGLTEHAQVFKEILGHKVNITTPSIENLMVYLEKRKPKYHENIKLMEEGF
ncbi:phenol-soluble modulin export ABC transporter ATP-binding protein PmtA [Staphylococcus aureus]|uniref:phenol-soluble modulin export ABC transporter ATP-binding protein PmtA n=1 Tax=Staphylococcus aureus TaxID=1280 RepID=UPI000768F7A8|nr:phenol-soluble modulin export ABC transporter ATP-binding protein PmtA [Staphylococcus aureus]CXI98210.1 ABC transporter ATP-binding protein [Staphylococcus aureus]CXK82280.1 ABC transporter ATP-binding protein [Staphylococcus aureus]CXQ07122.1 ABC transporter ATP-binding protein [Staphylococcus aureus]CXT67415.1 ABC transporter ATP-binding protein [Staphylococcus aureus]CXV63141.1 ABC transporter ATP-binding protein [Staphylococcus aureus]